MFSLDCFVLQDSTNRLARELMCLKNQGNQLIQSTGNVVAARLKLQESELDQRLDAVKQTISKLQINLATFGNQHSKFYDTCTDLEKFLESSSQSFNKLDIAEPNELDGEAIDDRIKQLTRIATSFAQKETDLDLLNRLAHVHPLPPDSSKRVDNINSRWQGLLSGTKNKCRTLQRLLLSKQDFKEKCTDWLRFLCQVESDLNVPLAGNYEDLLEQKVSYEAFENDLYSRQQTFLFILAEGNQMVKNCSSTDADDLRFKLNQLDDQWQSIILRTNCRRANIADAITQWCRYQAQLDRLQQKLSEVEENLETVDSSVVTLQMLKTLQYKYQVS